MQRPTKAGQRKNDRYRAEDTGSFGTAIGGARNHITQKPSYGFAERRSAKRVVQLFGCSVLRFGASRGLAEHKIPQKAEPNNRITEQPNTNNRRLNAAPGGTPVRR